MSTTAQKQQYEGACALLMLAACNLLLLGILLPSRYLSSLQMREILGQYSPGVIAAGLVIAAGSFIASLGIVARVLSRLGFAARVYAAAIMLGAVVCACTLPPRTNRIYFDEHIYQAIGLHIKSGHGAFLCNDCDVEPQYTVRSQEYNKQPVGHPTLLSFFYRLFGSSNASAHLASTCAYALGVFSVFLIVWLLFSDAIAACGAAALYALTPLVLRWSATTSAEPATSAWSAFGVAMVLLYLKEPAYRTALLAFSALGISLAFRPESILITVPVALLLCTPAGRAEWRSPRFYLGGLLFAVLLGVELSHLWAVRQERWGSSGDKFSLEAFLPNLSVNGPFYYLNVEFPVVFTVCALLGVLRIRSAPLRVFSVLIWFLYSWGIFLFFYAGSYHYGADERFSLISAAPLSVLGGLGIGLVVERLGRIIPSKVAALLVSMVVVGAWIPFIPHIRLIGQEADDARFDVAIAERAAAMVPRGSIVLSHVPTMWFMFGRNSLQTSAATSQPEYVARLVDGGYPSGVFFHRGAWCNYADKTQNRFCETIFDDYELEELASGTLRERVYGVYRMVRRKSVPLSQ